MTILNRAAKWPAHSRIGVMLALVFMAAISLKPVDSVASEPAARRGGVLSLQDRAEIQDLISSYAIYIDFNEPKAWASLFAVDGEFLIPEADLHLKGHDQLLAWASAAFKDRENRREITNHFVGATLLVKMSDGSVHARCKCLDAREEIPPGKSAERVPVAICAYNDVFVKTPKGWRFASREGGTEIPLSAEFLPEDSK